MASPTSESPTREGLLARRAVLMAELGMLDADFDDHGLGHRHTETHWACIEEYEQITVLIEAESWFSADEIHPGRADESRGDGAYQWFATA